VAQTSVPRKQEQADKKGSNLTASKYPAVAGRIVAAHASRLRTALADYLEHQGNTAEVG
jgi:hypothetical protein